MTIIYNFATKPIKKEMKPMFNKQMWALAAHGEREDGSVKFVYTTVVSRFAFWAQLIMYAKLINALVDAGAKLNQHTRFSDPYLVPKKATDVVFIFGQNEQSVGLFVGCLDPGFKETLAVAAVKMFPGHAVKWRTVPV